MYAVAIIGAAAAVFVLLSGSGSTTYGKTIKALGRNHSIFRDDFE